MSLRFEASLSALPVNLLPLLRPRLAVDHFPAFLDGKTVTALCAAANMDENTLALALLPLAAACAATPLSHFNVGAIAHGASGALYFGANLEFPGMPLQQTVHAEQSAITHAWMLGERALRAITVNYTPCGHCRQFMNELNSGIDLAIQLPGRQAAALADYLPEAFGPRDLNISTLLMDTCDHGLLIDGCELEQAAIVAANRSHAPYSQAYSGIALAMDDGTIFSGSYAENAAYNPSLPPLQVALNLMNLNNYKYNQIHRAVLAQRHNAMLDQWSATKATLASLNCHNLEQVTASQHLLQ